MTVLSMDRTRSTVAVIDYIAQDGQVHSCTQSDALPLVAEDFQPCRSFTFRHEQRHAPGMYWSVQDRRFLPFESQLERAHLTRLEWDPRVVRMTTQPFRITAYAREDRWQHIPDIFARYMDGSAGVIDVKHPAAVDDPDVQLQARRTAQLCEEIGWTYELVAEPPRQELVNLDFLSAFRRTFVTPEGLRDHVVALAQHGISIDQLCGQSELPELTKALALHLVWHHELTIPIDRPITGSTILTRELRPCA